MSDVLSQSEVESLLDALDPPSSSGGAGGPVSHIQNDLNRQISVYDFKRPERVSKEQMRAFQALHEGFSREFGATLSGLLRSIIEVKLISVDQLTYSEFVFSLENPTCFNLLESKGLNGNIILDLNPSIIFPIVDRLMGGGTESIINYPSRALTEIELIVVGRVTDIALRSLEGAWSNLCDLGLSIVQVESNPQLVQIVPPNEVVVLISFEITMGEMRGIMNLCIPYNSIEPLSGKLSSDTWSAYQKRVADPRQKLNLETGVSQASVNMNIQLAETTITAGEVTNLQVGDVIVTEKDHREGVKILVEGRPLFNGQPGLFKGRKAIEITNSIKRLKDVIKLKLDESETSSEDDQSPDASSLNSIKQ
ncbi:Flagellar motor switch protein FliM [hydrothermal vent metagenome]|uniref:Flagellar motor switch protein FliM n=1 Tax=hydrothermal vent metagenome TaxID=652676 RepID=A0A3B1DXT6_9ZZZZ